MVPCHLDMLQWMPEVGKPEKLRRKLVETCLTVYRHLGTLQLSDARGRGAENIAAEVFGHPERLNPSKTVQFF